MIDPRFSSVCLLSLALITGVGCTPEASSSSTSATVSDAPAPEPTDVLTVAQVMELSEDIRTLRDRVEQLEFELEESKSRQRQLYDDLDARLRIYERNTGADDTHSGLTSQSEEDQPADETQPVTGESSDDTVATEEVEQAAEPEPEPTVDPAVVREAYDSAFRTLRQGKYEDSIIEFENLIKTYPESDLVDDAWYWIAEANYVTQKLDLALTGFERIIRDYPNNQRASEAMLKIGYIHYELKNYEEAQNYLLQVIDRYPASRSVFSARRRLDKMERDGLF